VAITVSSNSADAGSGVASAAFQRSPAGMGTWTTIATDVNSPYSVAWDTTAVADGLYDLRVVTTDNVGNTFNSPAVANIKVDNTAPTGSVTAPPSGVNVAGAAVTIGTAPLVLLSGNQPHFVDYTCGYHRARYDGRYYRPQVTYDGPPTGYGPAPPPAYYGRPHRPRWYWRHGYAPPPPPPPG
jgi:hypothetical protein